MSQPINNSDNIRPFWLLFIKRKDGFLRVECFGHNPIADYRHYKDFVGCKMIEIDMESLEK